MGQGRAGQGIAQQSTAAPVQHRTAQHSSIPDEGMQGISIGHPSYEARVGRQGDDSISGNAEIPLCRSCVTCEHVVHQTKELHHTLILPQVLMTLHA